MAALDSRRGIADERGRPWHGKIPGDITYYRSKIATGVVLMGYGLYEVLSQPYPGGTNYVATTKDAPLRDGFMAVHDVRAFLKDATEDVWNVGGAGLYSSTIDFADELYLTKIQADFHCTKYFPVYETAFRLVSESEPMTENGVTYTFCVYTRAK
ncbi:MAG TPA: dihydrofolate reductase [Candidatus Saccharimonadales bacterium]|nr:dihydrofolate reductase [Candidatus Saccharimonadales bacterium]